MQRSPSGNSTALPHQADDLPDPVPDNVATAGAGGDGQEVPNTEAAAMGVDEVPARSDTPGAEAVELPNGDDAFADGGGLPNALPNVLVGAENFQTMSMVAPTIPPFPFFTPMPPVPPDLTTFTNAELDRLEGNQRRNVEERIKLLFQIGIILDSTSILMNNYQMMMYMPTEPPTAAATTSSGVEATTFSALRYIIFRTVLFILFIIIVVQFFYDLM